MAYLTSEQLNDMGFKHLGDNVKISNKAAIYNPEMISIGDNSRIDDFCVVSGVINIGNNVHLAPYVLLAGGTEGITLEDFSGCAYHVQIFTQSDDYSGKSMTNPTVPSEFKKETKKAIKLGRHVIVGAGSIVFPGASLAEGCSVGAMSVVTRPTKDWGVYLGNPAKRLKDRSRELLELESKYMKDKK